jgi:hypothetical protein
MVYLCLEFVSTATNNFQRSVKSLANWRRHELPSTDNLSPFLQAGGRQPSLLKAQTPQPESLL